MTGAEVLMTASGVLGGMIAGVLAAAIASRTQIRRDRERQQREMMTAISDAIDRVAVKHNDSISKLHHRDNSALERLARIEGKLEHIDRLLTSLQDRYITQPPRRPGDE